MPRPRTKAQLLSEGDVERRALESFLTMLTERQMTQPGALGSWTAKDVLAHLAEWDRMLIGWLTVSQRGKAPDVPAKGYKWSQLPALNEAIRRKHASRSVKQVLAMFRRSRRQVVAAIEALPEEVLFTPGFYPWLKTNTLASYFTSCTSSHDRWARNGMRKALKRRPG